MGDVFDDDRSERLNDELVVTETHYTEIYCRSLVRVVCMCNKWLFLEWPFAFTMKG